MYNQQKILSRGDKVKIDKSAGDGLEKCKKENEVNGMQGIVVRWSRHSSLTILVKLDNSNNKVVKVPVTWCVAVGETQQQKMLAGMSDAYRAQYVAMTAGMMPPGMQQPGPHATAAATTPAQAMQHQVTYGAAGSQPQPVYDAAWAGMAS